MSQATVPQPLFISSRLMVAAHVGDGTIHVEWTGETDSCGRDKVHYIVELTDDETLLAEGDDLAVHGGTYVDAIETLCTFLEAAGESYGYAMRQSRDAGTLEEWLRDSENGELFPLPCAEWAHRNSDELSMLAEDLRAATEGRSRNMRDTHGSNWTIGRRVRVSAGSGIDSGKLATVVSRTVISVDDRGVPRLAGHYKPVSWPVSAAVRFDDGRLDVYPKTRLVTAKVEVKP